jgi:hypothetical protein
MERNSLWKMWQKNSRDATKPVGALMVTETLNRRREGCKKRSSWAQGQVQTGGVIYDNELMQLMRFNDIDTIKMHA